MPMAETKEPLPTPDPKDLNFLSKAGLSSARQYDFALANAVLKRIEARSQSISNAS